MALGPASLLDVGCGEGRLLEQLGQYGVPAEGVDTSARRLTVARERGCRAREAEASSLPYEDRTFDWVVIRHVLHHLNDPKVAVAEAWRVARAGVILAEPTADDSLPGQREMARFDAFTTRLHARTGHIHHPYLRAGELLALVAASPRRVEMRGYGELTLVPEDEARALALAANHGEELAAEDRATLEEFLESARAGGLAYNSSTAVFVFAAE